MVYPERSGRSAAVVHEDGSIERMSRIPFMEGSFNEAWLQKLIADNPFLLPTEQISSQYSDLVCIGREVPVGSGETQGYIDNLYVTPSGNIVLVETKLFRNQESRRTVVAQIIDYAKELQRWDAERLNGIASDYFMKISGQAARIIDVMSSKGYLTFSDEGGLTDSINFNLSHASFLLLIVGDGIRTGVQQLADFLNENASMSFNLGLVELEIYQQENDTIIIPNLLTKTQVIERYVPTHEEPRSPIQSQYERKPVLSRREFISTFADNGGYDPDQITEFISDIESINGLSVGIAPTELTIRFSPEEGYSAALLTFSISGGHSDLYIMPGRIKASLEKHGKFPFEADDFLDYFKRFIDRKRCKTEPYEYEAGFYYAKVEDVLLQSQDLITKAEGFVNKISSSD